MISYIAYRISLIQQNDIWVSGIRLKNISRESLWVWMSKTSYLHNSVSLKPCYMLVVCKDTYLNTNAFHLHHISFLLVTLAALIRWRNAIISFLSCRIFCGFLSKWKLCFLDFSINEVCGIIKLLNINFMVSVIWLC